MFLNGTALHIACQLQNIEIVQLLVSKRATKIDLKDKILCFNIHSDFFFSRFNVEHQLN